MQLYVHLGFLAIGLVFVGMLLSTQRLIRAVFGLFGVLFSVAAQFVLLGSPFLGAAQVIIYIGGILVLVIFGIMLTGRYGLHLKTPQSPITNVLPALVLGLALLFGLLWALWPMLEPGFSTATSARVVSTNTLGQALLTDYLPVFEWAGVLLLVALMVAAYFMREPEREQHV